MNSSVHQSSTKNASGGTNIYGLSTGIFVAQDNGIPKIFGKSGVELGQVLNITIPPLHDYTILMIVEEVNFFVPRIRCLNLA